MFRFGTNVIAGSSLPRNCAPVRGAYDGIEAIVPEPYLIGVQPAYSLAVGGVRVLVRTRDAAEAVRLLQDFVTAATIGAPGP